MSDTTTPPPAKETEQKANQELNHEVKLGWFEALKVYSEGPTLRMLALGFAAGLPLLLVLGTLSFRLREAGIDRATIGYLTWVGLAYGFKWCWAPLIDRLPIPGLTAWLGRRRSWLLVAQLAVMVGLVGMALIDPRVSLDAIVGFALLVAFASATQDIALDAYRIESADTERQAALAAAYQTGYRLAMIWAGAGVLWIAARAEVATAANYDPAAWRTAYLWMAASMLIGVIAVFMTKEPQMKANTDVNAKETSQLTEIFRNTGIPIYGAYLAFTQLLLIVSVSVIAISNLLFATQNNPLIILDTYVSIFDFAISNLQWLRTTIKYFIALGIYGSIAYLLAIFAGRIPVPAILIPLIVWYTQAFLVPFADFFRRYRWQAVSILALIAIYRISDIVMGVMANPFYVDMGYTKDEVAAVTKVYGVVMTLVGAFIGGILSMRLGVLRVLMLGAVLSAASNLLFAWLGTRGHDVQALIWVVSADNLASGIASAAFIAYLSSLTNVQYSATQYALFSSLMLLLPKFLAGFSGAVVNAVGYGAFFTGTAVLGLPVLILVYLASRQDKTTG